MRRQWFIFLLPVVACARPIPFQHERGDNDRRERDVLNRQRALSAAIRATNWDRMASMLADEVKYVHGFGRVDDKQALLTNIRRFAQFSRWENRVKSVRAYGDVALIHSDLFTAGVTHDGTEDVASLRGLEVWAYRGGTWQLVAHQSTPFQPVSCAGSSTAGRGRQPRRSAAGEASAASTLDSAKAFKRACRLLGVARTWPGQREFFSKDPSA